MMQLPSWEIPVSRPTTEPPTHDRPMIISNAITLVLAGTILALKPRHG